MEPISRRRFIKAAGAAAATLSTNAETEAAKATRDANAAQPAQKAAQQREAYTFFKANEARFIEAAAARLIPTDETGPGATEAGVSSFIDKQLSAAWGAGERLYRSGPWQNGAATQGYQLPFTPAELFRHALRAIDADVSRQYKTTFEKLSPIQQDEYLRGLENGNADLDGVPSKVFFESLLEMTLEGFFSDPAYGGNKDMVSWRMIGFPGAYANFYQLVDQHGVAFTGEPTSLAEDSKRVIHIHPNIPAYPAKGT
jgi:gluconate 2-dehydrogenase gamma chain